MIVIWEWFNFDQDLVIGLIDNKIDEKAFFSTITALMASYMLLILFKCENSKKRPIQY